MDFKQFSAHKQVSAEQAVRPVDVHPLGSVGLRASAEANLWIAHAEGDRSVFRIRRTLSG